MKKNSTSLAIKKHKLNNHEATFFFTKKKSENLRKLKKIPILTRSKKMATL